MTAASPVADRDRHRRRWTAAWTIIGGLAVLAGATGLALSWRDELPDPLASHWGAAGTPNGYSSLAAVLWVLLVGGTVLVLGFGLLALNRAAIARRIGAGAAIGSALLFATVTVGSLSGQRGLADARDAGGVGGILLLAIAGALLVGVVVGLVVPGDEHQPTTAPVDPAAPRVALADRTVWRASVVSAPALLIGSLAGVAIAVVAVVTRFWILAIPAAVLATVVGVMSAVVVLVDERGLTVRSPLGWPRTKVALDEVVRADVTEVRPLRDFGGWGWRIGRAGRVGIVLRGGEALLVERTGGRSLAVTVDDAATGAGLLNALADRARR